MTEHQKKISELENRIDALVRTQIDFQKEISALRGELVRLRSAAADRTSKAENVSFFVPADKKDEEPAKNEPRKEPPAEKRVIPPVTPPTFGYSQSGSQSGPQENVKDNFSERLSDKVENAQSNLERFIGENLISKIGIVVLIIGVGIGVKYSIDNNLISPLTRIIFGYIFGFGLVGLAIKLKPKYLNFSAALISGGMAIMYFVTYFAYSLYSLIPQTSAFALMVMFTAFTVTSSVVYNRQIIAHIGLVGAYAVPFLLSTDSGNYVALFSYMTVINLGILAVSIRKKWKPLFFSSFGFTWIIFCGWFVASYSAGDDFYRTLLFLGIFFAIFFAVSIVQRLPGEDESEISALMAPLLTVLVFYGVCLGMIEGYFDAVRAWTFFAFLTTVTTAILLASFRYLGRLPVYLSFIFAWLIFGVWFGDRYVHAEHLNVAPVFALLLFGIFYTAILGHRLITKHLILIENTGLVLTNAFIFYGVGYSILIRNGFDAFLGLYTLVNAGLHFGVAAIVAKFRTDAEDVLQVLTILILTFLSITVPVQFDGNIVTMIWAAEAALLFWYGRRNGVKMFEYFSYPVMVLAVVSMFFDWMTTYAEKTLTVNDANPLPLANGDLVTALVVTAAFGFIYFINSSKDSDSAIPADLKRPFGIAVAVIATFIFYNTFRIEIGNYYHLAAVNLNEAGVKLGASAYDDLDRFSMIWQLNYTLAFLVGMAAINLRKIGSEMVASINCLLAAAVLAMFLTMGMVGFYELRETYLIESAATGSADWFNIAIRYISYVFAGLLMYALYLYRRSDLFLKWMPVDAQRTVFEALATIVLFIILSCDLLNIMAQYRIQDAEKLGLSILWGVFSLGLIAYGIARNRKHLRIAAIALLGVTLVKLFFYDAADLDTIPKTILFVTLGITLLAASFLYNKYKEVIFGVSADEHE